MLTTPEATIHFDRDHRGDVTEANIVGEYDAFAKTQ